VHSSVSRAGIQILTQHQKLDRTGPVLSVSPKIDKTGTKFKSEKIWNRINKPDKKLINRPVLPVYRTSFSKTNFIDFAASMAQKSGKINKNNRYCCQLFVHMIHNLDM
jgi:hypothetical protein